MANNVSTIPGYQRPLGYTQITSLSAATGLGTIPDNSVIALIQPETKSIRWTDDNLTTPTASVGMVLAAGDTLLYTGKMAFFQMIETAASAKVNISFYKKE